MAYKQKAVLHQNIPGNFSLMEQLHNQFTSIIDAVIHLHNQGFTADFGIWDNRLFCTQAKCFFTPEQFDVLEVYSFDGENDYKTETVLYVIECYGVAKGILLQTIYKTVHNEPNILVQKLRKFWK